jgi:23S rRNA (pseudouridine1915-N3)-methyltransferase
MLGIKLICVGKLREKHMTAAFEEYQKRLGAFCKFQQVELTEIKVSETPSEKELASALEREGTEILRQLDPGAYVIALCVEGVEKTSEELAKLFETCALSGKSKLCFVIGGSFGLHEMVKARADIRLSMSKMTFPHHLARVMLSEQIYRAFTILAGTRYHK